MSLWSLHLKKRFIYTLSSKKYSFTTPKLSKVITFTPSISFLSKSLFKLGHATPMSLLLCFVCQISPLFWRNKTLYLSIHFHYSLLILSTQTLSLSLYPLFLFLFTFLSKCQVATTLTTIIIPNILKMFSVIVEGELHRKKISCVFKF